MNSQVTVVLLLALAGCGAVPDEAKCTRGTLEADLRVTGPLTGPGIDAATGKLKPGNYILSTTYLKLKPEAAAQQQFQSSMVGISAALPTQDGLVAYQLATSTECQTARTLSVWRDDAAMYQFAAGEAHRAASANVSKISRGGSYVTHWAATEAAATMETAASRIADVTAPEY